MYRRYGLGISSQVGRQFSTMSSTTTPIEDAVRAKITDALNPSTFEIYNDSHLHAHHKAMKGNMSHETHFRLVITSAAFQQKKLQARHRLVYAVLCEELQGGIHALQLRTMTPDEEQKHNQKQEKAAAAAAAAAAAEAEDEKPTLSPTSTTSEESADEK